MQCIECGEFIPQGMVGHFAGGFIAAPLCRPCSQKARGITHPPKTVPIDLIPGMEIGHLPDPLISDLLDFGPCGGIWGELRAPRNEWHTWEVRRFSGTYTLRVFSWTNDPEHRRAYWRGEDIQCSSLARVLTYQPISRNAWCWYPWKSMY